MKSILMKRANEINRINHETKKQLQTLLDEKITEYRTEILVDCLGVRIRVSNGRSSCIYYVYDTYVRMQSDTNHGFSRKELQEIKKTLIVLFDI